QTGSRGTERAQVASARLLRKRGARNDDAGVIAMTDDKHLGGRRARRRRPQVAVAPASGGNRATTNSKAAIARLRPTRLAMIRHAGADFGWRPTRPKRWRRARDGSACARARTARAAR